MTKLTIKQENFCNKYVECGNASEAYRHAYSCDKMKAESVNRLSFELLNNIKITSRVEELKDELKSRSNITKDRILEELSTVGFSSMKNYYNNWIDRKQFEDLSDAQKSAIKTIQVRTRKIITEDNVIEIEEVKVELYDKLKAIDTINKMLGFDAPIKTEHTGKDGKDLFVNDLSKLTTEELLLYHNLLEKSNGKHE